MPPLIAGNWKMNGLQAQLGVIAALADAVDAAPPPADIVICLPATLIAEAAILARGLIAIGGQDCDAAISGRFTGDISAEMLKDAGASAVIVGHSERRHQHGETDCDVAAKAGAALRAGLLGIVCIGESAEQRSANKARRVCRDQIAGSLPRHPTQCGTVIAYEPLWAIGAESSADTDEISAMLAHIRSCLVAQCGEVGKTLRILYGGAVDPSNAAGILALPEIGGVLVGGASQTAAAFEGVFRSAPPCGPPFRTQRRRRFNRPGGAF
jgi:triosephosphate isomerase